MALRKQQVKHISSDSQQMDENTQEDDSATDRDTGDELSSLLLSTSATRETRWREQDNKAKHKAVSSEMTEEEMMDLALRLSEREASVSALQRQQEEEAVMKAIQESMVGQTQPGLTSQKKTLLADASLRLSTRRKLSYSNGVRMSAVDQGVPEDGRTSESDLNLAKEAGDEKIPCIRKRKRKAGSPLLEMPDLSQSQNSPCRFEPSSAALDSPRSSDSTQIDDSQLQKSPVFPLTSCSAAVHINRLSQNLVETCRSSGFVLCSQDSWAPTELRSPTFPRSNPISCPKSPVFSETRQGDIGQVERSPASDRNGQHETDPSACKLHDCENSEFVFSSQESLSPSVRSPRSKSPVFPKSPKTSKLPPSASPSFLSQTEENNERSLSPVFGVTEPRLRIHTSEEKRSAGSSGSELRGPDSEEKFNSEEKTKSDGCLVDQLNICPPEPEKLNKKSEDWSSSKTQLTSDMTLVWSDEDEDDNTPVGSPSPVFPEEKPLHQADGQAASLTQEAAASQGKTRSGCRTQISTTEEESHPISRQEEDCRASSPPGESSGGPTVHYYWGVPFCPQGLDPDTYTQVILAQMEVYQASLKRAQRSLLRKAEWGGPIQPQPEKSPSPEAPDKSPQLQVPRRKGLRLRARKINEAAEEEERKEEEDEQQENKEEEKNRSDEEQMDTDDCDVCPETQLSSTDTPDLTVLTDADAEPFPKSPELPEAERILQHTSAIRDKPQEEEEEEEEAMDANVKTKENVSGWSGDGRSQTVGEEADVQEDVEEMKRSASPELQLAVVPRSPDSSVDCPICQASFPVNEIELHAAYCDGEVAVVGERRPDGDSFQESVKLRRKRIRRAERTAEGINDSDICSNQERCYICHKAVPLREYSRHTELCIHGRTSRPKGNLLSALEQTESRGSDAGPSGSKVQPEAVIDLRDDDDDDGEEEAASAFRISDSPIRSFTSISEATGCLIDFRKQHRTKKPSQRRR
ncbi:BRCA1-A complex subunit RAP80 isoform X2 [Kryptolebias marmoratus]|uniref:BRCA1-A complex subunit RAP80 isoform X2 n=1 Tax=Kryptolebias marmoratus TaxID=37003 RepID=UPI000D52F8CC|nr:BRCA1-A complex subunit RAP80 isoform X2 [Kryptolebias marmoratus]